MSADIGGFLEISVLITVQMLFIILMTSVKYEPDVSEAGGWLRP
jgi:hypothetical protein